MAKQSKSVTPNKGGGEGRYKNGVPGKFVSRNLMAVNPKREQFEPTPAEPVRQHYKLAGGC
jgi:hypothetical protein